MISKVFALAAFATAVVAQSTCSTGPVQCCNSVQTVDHNEVHQALTGSPFSLIDVLAAVGDITVPIGVTCNPISAGIALGGNSCNAQTVCCDNNNFNGVVAVGCTPINVNA